MKSVAPRKAALIAPGHSSGVYVSFEPASEKIPGSWGEYSFDEAHFNHPSQTSDELIITLKGKNIRRAVGQLQKDQIRKGLEFSLEQIRWLLARVSPSAAAHAAPEAERIIADLKAAAGGAYSGEELQAKLRCTRQALTQRRAAFTIVYWTDAQGRCSYPKWQFDGDMRVKRPIKQVLKLLSTHDTHYVLSIFLTPATGLRDRSVLDLIRADQAAEAVRHVQAITHER